MSTSAGAPHPKGYVVKPSDPPAAGDETAEFAAFVTRHGQSLDRLAYLMVGDEHIAEDLAAEVLLISWRQWSRVKKADHPILYVRRILINQAAGHFRKRARELNRLEHLKVVSMLNAHTPDSATVVDVRALLLLLPPRQRACLVLRYAFDLTEREVSVTLGISVGTVKSQTSKAAAQFRRQAGNTFGHSGDLPAPGLSMSTRSRMRNHGA